MLVLRWMTFAILLTFAASTAWAERTRSSLPNMARDATFERVPKAEDLWKQYPVAAIRDGVEGRAYLCCVANYNRTLSCYVGQEFPAGYGFGAAAIEVAEPLKVTMREFRTLRALGKPKVYGFKFVLQSKNGRSLPPAIPKKNMCHGVVS